LYGRLYYIDLRVTKTRNHSVIPNIGQWKIGEVFKESNIAERIPDSHKATCLCQVLKTLLVSLKSSLSWRENFPFKLKFSQVLALSGSLAGDVVVDKQPCSGR